MNDEAAKFLHSNLSLTPTDFSTGKIWAIGGGKGGVGKSFVSANIAVCLSRLGKRVCLVDLDLGSANLHTYLGLSGASLTLSDFLKNRIKNFSDLATKTNYERLDLISGYNDTLDVANLQNVDLEKIQEGIRKLNYDYIILDLGAGTHQSTLDFYLMAENSFIVTSPEPTSIENAYRFLRASFYRKLRSLEHQLNLREIIDSCMDQKNQLGIRTPCDLIKHVSLISPVAGERMRRTLSQFQINIIMNQTRTQADVELGHSMASVCLKYFGIQTRFLGHLISDYAVQQSLRKRRPLFLEFPQCQGSQEILRICKHLVDTEMKKAVV